MQTDFEWYTVRISQANSQISRLSAFKYYKPIFTLAVICTVSWECIIFHIGVFYMTIWTWKCIKLKWQTWFLELALKHFCQSCHKENSYVHLLHLNGEVLIFNLAYIYLFNAIKGLKMVSQRLNTKIIMLKQVHTEALLTLPMKIW